MSSEAVTSYVPGARTDSNISLRNIVKHFEGEETRPVRDNLTQPLADILRHLMAAIDSAKVAIEREPRRNASTSFQKIWQS